MTLVHRPSTVEELREIVARAPRLRVVGSRHTFSDIADADELVSLDALPPAVEIGDATVSCGGAVRYGELARILAAEGLALHNLASLPHISVAGAVATATHGSGDGNGNLATAVAGLELVTSTGALVRARRGEEDFDGMVVALGALGAVTRVTLDVEPAYEVTQRVFEGMPWETLLARYDAIAASGYSVSVFTAWGETSSIWVKCRGDAPDELFGAAPAPRDRHPVAGMDPVNCTAQRGVPGAWWDRLPHFRMGFVPSVGEELQSEYIVPRAHAVAAIDAVRAVGPRLRPVLLIGEIRTIAADSLWMSPQYRQATTALHFTWRPDRAAVDAAVVELEAALAPFGARPHWGKVFHASPAHLYERREDFVRLAARLDPRGAFRNSWLERAVLDASRR